MPIKFLMRSPCVQHPSLKERIEYIEILNIAGYLPFFRTIAGIYRMVVNTYAIFKGANKNERGFHTQQVLRGLAEFCDLSICCLAFDIFATIGRAYYGKWQLA